MCQKHLALVNREAAGALVEVAVQSRFYLLWLAPFALVVFLREEYVACLCARYARNLVALSLVACRREVELVVLVAEEHGRIVGASRVEDVHFLHCVARAVLLPFGCLLCRLQSFACQCVFGHRVEHHLKLLFRLLIVAVSHQLTGKVEVCQRAVLLVAYDVSVSRDGFLRRVYAVVAVSQLARNLPALLALLRRCLRVGLLKLCGSVVVFADSEIFLCLLQVFLCAAGHEQQAENGDG